MPRGGQRIGAGRPVGTGKYDRPTKTMRVPVDMLADVALFLESKGYSIPLFSSRVPAGLPAPGDDHVEDYINLYKRLVSDPENTFSVPASGDSMINAGIFDGDLLIVNCHLEARHKSIVIASVDGQQTVKTLHIEKQKITLMPENENYRPIHITKGVDFKILGVVTNVIKTVI